MVGCAIMHVLKRTANTMVYVFFIIALKKFSQVFIKVNNLAGGCRKINDSATQFVTSLKLCLQGVQHHGLTTLQSALEHLKQKIANTK